MNHPAAYDDVIGTKPPLAFGLFANLTLQEGEPEGRTYEPTQDKGRLSAQHTRVVHAMQDGQWRTLAEIEAKTGAPQASISARLRDLRKPQFGAHKVERRRRTQGQYEYRVTLTPRQP